MNAVAAHPRRGVAIARRTARIERKPCDWEMSPEKYGECTRCGANWADWQKPGRCAEPSK